MHIRDMSARAFATNERKGFHETAEDLSIPTKLMLVVSELSEALEEYREGKPDVYYVNGKPEGFAIEIADAVIRLGDIAGIKKCDLEAAVSIKMDYNDTRPFRHGGKRI